MSFDTAPASALGRKPDPRREGDGAGDSGTPGVPESDRTQNPAQNTRSLDLPGTLKLGFLKGAHAETSKNPSLPKATTVASRVRSGTSRPWPRAHSVLWLWPLERRIR